MLDTDSRPQDPKALRAAASDAEAAGDIKHAVALRKAALFNERRLREKKHGCGEIAVWME